MSTARGRPRRQSVEEKEKRIIAAARTVFRKHGFEGAKVADIAKRAGVAEGTVYLYFENKKALLLGVAAEFYERLTRDAADGVRKLDTTIERLSFLSWLHFVRISKEWQLLAMAMTPYKLSNEYRKTEGYKLNRAYVQVFDEVVRGGIAQGEIRTDIPLSVMRDVFYGGLEYGARTMRARSAKVSVDSTAADFMRYFSAGMLLHPDTPATGNGREGIQAVTTRLEKIASSLEKTLDQPNSMPGHREV